MRSLQRDLVELMDNGPQVGVFGASRSGQIFERSFISS